MRASLYLIASAFMWGANFHLLKVMLSSVHFIEAAFWRYLFAVITLFVITLKNLPTWRTFIINSKSTLLIGIFGQFGFNLLLFWGLNCTTPVNASLIISLSPVTTLLLSSVFFKTRINSWQLLGTFLGISGVVFLLSKGRLTDLGFNIVSKGDLLVLLAMILASCYHLGVKKYMVNISNQHFTFLTNLICFLCFLLILPLSSIPELRVYSGDFWIAAVLFGIVGTALTYLFWNKGIEMVGPARAGVYMNLVPLATALMAVILGQAFNNFHYVSGLLIVLGLVVFRSGKGGSRVDRR